MWAYWVAISPFVWLCAVGNDVVPTIWVGFTVFVYGRLFRDSRHLSLVRVRAWKLLRVALPASPSCLGGLSAARLKFGIGLLGQAVVGAGLPGNFLQDDVVFARIFRSVPLKSQSTSYSISKMEADQHIKSAEKSIISPFSDTESTTSHKRPKKNPAWWIILGLPLLVCLVAGSFFLNSYLNDPLRTLEEFPVGKYMEGYKAVAGSKFRADLRVENDLGWKEGIGRLMVFSVKNESQPIVVMIPPALAAIYFVKGQAYQGELEVKEGGLIYANSCRKN